MRNIFFFITLCTVGAWSLTACTDDEEIVASGDVERCDRHIGILRPIDLVDVMQWSFSLHDVDDGGGIQHFQCRDVGNSQSFHDDRVINNKGPRK